MCSKILRHENSAGEKLKAALEHTVTSLRSIVEEIRTKEDTIQKLQTHIESMPPSVLTRTFYTQRILSIVANVKKQNEEMHRVLEDVKSVQREINSIQGKVERTFTVTDEIIFRMAKSDETARRIYKYLISLQTDCSDIQKLVKESGNLSREIKDLEDQAETELRKNIATKIRRLQSDLEQIRTENQILEERVGTKI
ncbi:coiled-coil domain-containing protein 22 homolog [Daphnia pulex]|uniref:coiled-coil domain-containing protein 22 homolog n=2 Tax=Daphnia pulex TaxID=6669 RepID=UPI001EDEA4CE|nr:coiled-coil domain-containing protein 22 homolog [Daphnia pulex]XP_046460351.1 coiled-coil domain-containing protein 22 homolog [Daphnia pulex]